VTHVRLEPRYTPYFHIAFLQALRLMQRNFLYTQENLDIQDSGFPGQEGGSKAERKHTADVCDSSGLCTSAFPRGPWEKRCRDREKKQHPLRKGNVIPDQICNSPLDSVISQPREITRYRACPKGKLRVVMPTQNRQIFWGKVFTDVRYSVHALEISRGFPGVVYLLLNVSKLSLKLHCVEITVHT
jgi:hypothetical protein